MRTHYAFWKTNFPSANGVRRVLGDVIHIFRIFLQRNVANR